MARGMDRDGPRASYPALGLPDDFDMDRYLVSAGLRALGKWEGVPAAEADVRVCELTGRGLVARFVPPDAGRFGVVYFARDAAVLDDAEGLELAYRASRTFAARAPASRALGELLGYPSCCVEAWATGPQEDEPAIARLAARLDAPSPALLNFFPRGVAPVGFVPCALTCTYARAHATTVCRRLEHDFGVSEQALREVLRGVVLFESGPFHVQFTGVSDLSPGGFAYEGVRSPVEAPTFPRYAELTEPTARIEALLRAARAHARLVVDADALRLEGSGASVVLGGRRPEHLVAFMA